MIAPLKIINKTAYNELILSQEDTVCFCIFDEEEIRDNKYGDKRIVWVKLTTKFYPTTRDYITRLRKKFAERELDNTTKNPKEWIAKLELIRGYLRNMDVYIDDTEIMTNILSNYMEATIKL